MSRIAHAFDVEDVRCAKGRGGAEGRGAADTAVGGVPDAPRGAADTAVGGVPDAPPTAAPPHPAPRRKAFIAFVTGGDPSLEHSEKYILALIEGGADLIEIGIPFSDPIAEGPVIQEANLRALAAGTTVDGIFGLVRSLRRRTQVPIVLLTYLNPVHHYGYEAFFATCAEAGVDGIIVPDLPYDEKDEIAAVAAANDVDVISLIAPTSAARVERIAAEATGYIYLVSSLGVTGVRAEITTDLDALVKTIRGVTDVPVAVGFGIHTPEQARAVTHRADAAIVGSAIVRMIAADPEAAPAALCTYARAMKAAMEE